MKLAYSTNAYMRYPVLEAIDHVADLGYEGIELMADVPHLWPAETSDGQIDRVRHRLQERGLTVANVNAFMMNAVRDFWHPSWIEPDSSFRQLRTQHTIAALTMAKKLGARCITTEPGGPLEPDQSRDHAMDLFVAGLSTALSHAESLGVSLLVEPEPGLLVENAEQFVQLAEVVDSPMFGLNFDVGHFYCVGDPLPETIARLAKWARHYHIEDIAHTRVHEHLIPGRGAIDFDATMGAIKATGYRGWITVELYPYADDPDGAGAEALAHLAERLPA